MMTILDVRRIGQQTDGNGQLSSFTLANGFWSDRTRLFCLREETELYRSTVLWNGAYGIPLFYLEYGSPGRCRAWAFGGSLLFPGLKLMKQSVALVNRLA